MPSDDESTPGADHRRLHAYVASFLSPAAADEAIGDLDVHRAGSTRELFRAAHVRLTARIDVPGDLEVAVLIEDIGLTPDDVAYVVGLPTETVRTIVRAEELRPPLLWPEPVPTAPAEPPIAPAEPRAGAADEDRGEPLLVEPGTVPPLFDDEIEDAPPRDRRPRPGRRTLTRLLLVLGLAVSLVVAIASSGGGPVADCVATPEQPVCIDEARLTDVVDSSGTPGAARSRFDLGEPVKLWFSFDLLDGAERAVDYVWYREDEVLYASSFPLPAGGRVNLSLARVFAEVPGEYRVEVRDGDDLLIEESFRIG